MPARLIHINLRNAGGGKLNWVTDHLTHGIWTDPWLPSQKAAEIPPGGVGSWRSESAGIMTGTEGWVLFRTVAWDGNASYGELIPQFIKIEWSVAYIDLDPPRVQVSITQYDPTHSSNSTEFNEKLSGKSLVEVRTENSSSGDLENFWNEIQNTPESLILAPFSWVGTVSPQHHLFLDLVVSGSSAISFGPVTDIEPPVKFKSLFKAVNKWATSHGYIGAFPNFHKADYGEGNVYGTILIKPSAGEFKDIPATELGNPQSLEDRFRAMYNYIRVHGLEMKGFDGFPPKPIFSYAYAGAFPTFFEADYGQGKVYGCILLKSEAVVWKDISAAELGNPVTPQDRFRTTNDYASKLIIEDDNFIGGFPNFYEAVHDKKKVYGIIFIKSGYADWKDIRYDELFPKEDIG